MSFASFALGAFLIVLAVALVIAIAGAIYHGAIDRSYI